MLIRKCGEQMQLTYATFKGHEGDALTVSAVRQKLQCQVRGSPPLHALVLA